MFGKVSFFSLFYEYICRTLKLINVKWDQLVNFNDTTFST